MMEFDNISLKASPLTWAKFAIFVALVFGLMYVASSKMIEKEENDCRIKCEHTVSKSYKFIPPNTRSGIGLASCTCLVQNARNEVTALGR